MTLASRSTDAQPLSYSWLLTARRSDLAHFRRLAKLAMREWDQDDAVTEVVLHGVTELLANVARHVPDPRCRLELFLEEDAVRVTVTDSSAALPRITLPDWSAEEGRGLWLLREMADGIGFEPTADGKRVWVRVGTR
ncbi:ATP-binding protein [Streptomyces carpaticus]|uniref:Serine/threonine-protein kinase RsbW n=2 Tax=Streptomyces TaxID=1883 RepID=A0A1I6VRR8_9ACTN|nr:MULTISPECIES: ATP-binding protein [Streptomyces]QKV71733.1 ATP-binding protein [Streptomyces harbinensis]UWM52227.1 ATP-binding protein [Streptomyces carpaticus]SFT16281.1 serine/threonine-protein kinase RsbW [Streptomyces harbinensis]